MWHDASPFVPFDADDLSATASCGVPRGRYSTSPGRSVTSIAGGGSSWRGMSSEWLRGRALPPCGVG